MNHMNRRMSRVVASLFAMAFVIAAGGCAHTRANGGGSADAVMADTVSGYYAGSWYGPDPEEPLGALTCTITPKGSGTWDALFAASFGGFGEYEVGLEGQREGDKVVFAGSMNLGETAGGVFNWDGEIVGGEFLGNYTSQFSNGTFKMSKTDPPVGE